MRLVELVERQRVALALVDGVRHRIDIGLVHAGKLRADRLCHAVAVAGIAARRADEAGLAGKVAGAALVIPFEAAGRQHDALAGTDGGGAAGDARRTPTTRPPSSLSSRSAGASAMTSQP